MRKSYFALILLVTIASLSLFTGPLKKLVPNPESQLGLVFSVDNNRLSPLCANLEAVSYYTSALPFVDLMKTSGYWKTPNWENAVIDVDGDGWPTSLGEYPYIQLLLARSIDGRYPTGTYTVFYDGVGTLEFGFDAKNIQTVGSGKMTFHVDSPSADGILVKLTSIDSVNPIRNIRIILPGHETTYASEIFNPDFLNLVENFSAIRFMDWMVSNNSISKYYGGIVGATADTVTLGEGASGEDDFYNGAIITCQINGEWQHARMIDDYDGATKVAQVSADWALTPNGSSNCEILIGSQQEWSERPEKNDASWATIKGVPLEVMVDLANEINVDPWFNIPYMADDNYIREFATYVRNNLDSGRIVYLEYSNEVWNTAASFKGQSNYAVAKGLELGLDANRFYAGWKYRSKRTVEISNIWSEVFGESNLRASRGTSRLVRVLGGQNDATGQNTIVMDFVTDGRPASDYVDALAVTEYYSNIALSDLQNGKTVDELLNQMEASLPQAGSALYVNIANAKARGLDTVVYEGGTHTDAAKNLAEDSSENLLLNEVNAHPRMKDIVNQSLVNWRASGLDDNGKGPKLWCAFQAIGQWNRYGRWGHLQFLDENLSTAYRWQGLMEFAQDNPRWWTDNGTAPPSPTCTSFTYTAWSPETCPANLVQSRVVASQSPSGCVGGNPVLTQSCTNSTNSPSSGGGGGGGGSKKDRSNLPATSTPTLSAREYGFSPLVSLFAVYTSGNHVRQLQQMLAIDRYYTGVISGYYDDATIEAVQTFQKQYGILSSGSPQSNGFGMAGPATRAKLNQLYSSSGSTTLSVEARTALIKQLQAQLLILMQQLLELIKAQNI